MSGRIDLAQVLRFWLADHPGGTVEDFERARAPFGAERGGRHRRVHGEFLSWLNQPHVLLAIGVKQPS